MKRGENVARFLERRTLVWERLFLDVDVDRLWEAVATREGLGRWFMPTPFEIEPGGRFSFQGGWDGTIAEVVRPHRIVFVPDGPDAGDAYLRFELEPAEGGALFRLIDKMGSHVDAAKIFGPDTPAQAIYQPGGTGTHWSGVASGYHGFVDALETHLTGRPFAFDDDAMTELYCELLDEWHGHADA